MRCDDLRPLLDMYLDGELPDETVRKLDRHLLRCPSCAYEVRTLEQTQAMLREAVPVADPSPAFRERTAARLLDALAPMLQPVPSGETGRQWSLPFAREE